MTLTQTLQLQERYLKYEDLRALDYCERRWQEENRPLKRWELVNFIEKMLRELQRNGVGYPKVLLLRKKEIQRKEFTIVAPEEQGSVAAECSCHEGWLLSGKPCPCPKGEPHREQLRKWGMKI